MNKGSTVVTHQTKMNGDLRVNRYGMFKRICLYCAVAFGAFLYPVFVTSPLSAKDRQPYQRLFDDLKVFTDVLSIIDRDYYRDVSSDELVEGAIKGMLTTLDPHSGYLEPDFYQDLRVQTKGEFGGLGIEITINKEGLLVVVAPMEGSPAEKAGVLPGDKIVKIEGKFTKEF
ncbi:MAG: PDZ domain-containing protein, partial [Bdellovibrionales bacterium]|nr:PDZ domain-containing protein [Bdellovibrionales bacterium]